MQATTAALFTGQDYGRYTESDHVAWKKLYERMAPLWERHAPTPFLDGLGVLQLDRGRIPRLEDVNRFMAARTGFVARAVSGYVPAFLFFDCLSRREFPTTVTIRPLEKLGYLPEPDIFHDICGHVPMHTDPAFAAALARFGSCARTAAHIAARANMESIIKALARFFWFTVEFGLMRAPDRLKACGSGLLSSHGEIVHALESSHVERRPAQLESMIHQTFHIDRYQPLLFVLESFEQLYDLVGTLERWMLEGNLNNVAPGEPSIGKSDLESFLAGATVSK